MEPSDLVRHRRFAALVERTGRKLATGLTAFPAESRR
jgi:hypothetical protein